MAHGHFLFTDAEAAYAAACAEIALVEKNRKPTLDLVSYGLTRLPPEIGQLTWVEKAFLNRNQLSDLPPDIGGMSALRILNLADNRLSDLPPEIGGLTALERLSLIGNRLTSLPPEIGQLTALKSLVLNANRLTTLPRELGWLPALEHLNTIANPLLPDEHFAVDAAQTRAVLSHLREAPGAAESGPAVPHSLEGFRRREDPPSTSAAAIAEIFHRIVWTPATRIIATRHPPIDLYERVSPDPKIWEALIQAEMLVNPRIRDETGDISLVAPEERISGEGASWVMAAFTHLNPKGSRFSDGTYGVYYAASELETAIAETAWHFGRFAADSGDGPRYEDMRVLRGDVDGELADLDLADAAFRAPLLDPDSYAASRAFGRRLKEEGRDGIHFGSVRRDGGKCVAVFRPKVASPPVQAGVLTYHWDGERVRHYFDHAAESWREL